MLVRPSSIPTASRQRNTAQDRATDRPRRRRSGWSEDGVLATCLEYDIHVSSPKHRYSSQHAQAMKHTLRPRHGAHLALCLQQLRPVPQRRSLVLELPL
ncbi:hypothetical protein PsYK624_137310 [Phanerochaete sordida]|uniref:Uncharacterized protein n=1 Tax=Phanerochaete sordida TaxID=48140 RepID=A0A9P3LJL9_9APHY|nr:hypothetical protein PsYK624_137310 [Phanerochaete sordida]